MTLDTFTKYERARILGARALQISMNAPLLIKIEKGDLEKINYDALKIAEVELNSDILPISIKKPFPQKKEERLRQQAAQNNTTVNNTTNPNEFNIKRFLNKVLNIPEKEIVCSIQINKIHEKRIGTVLNFWKR